MNIASVVLQRARTEPDTTAIGRTTRTLLERTGEWAALEAARKASAETSAGA